jgi:hypothetical protein
LLPALVHELPLAEEAEAKLSFAGRTTGGLTDAVSALAKFNRPDRVFPTNAGTASVPLNSL